MILTAPTGSGLPVNSIYLCTRTWIILLRGAISPGRIRYAPTRYHSLLTGPKVDTVIAHYGVRCATYGTPSRVALPGFSRLFQAAEREQLDSN